MVVHSLVNLETVWSNFQCFMFVDTTAAVAAGSKGLAALCKDWLKEKLEQYDKIRQRHIDLDDDADSFDPRDEFEEAGLISPRARVGARPG